MKANGFRRGDIVWADLDPTQGNEQRGRRPVVIVSEDIFNQKSGTVIAFALTSQPQKAIFPLTYKLTDAVGNKESWVKIGQIRALSVVRLGKKLGRVSQQDMQNILDGFNEIIGRV